MNLREAAVGRDNNFNLIRMVAATAVLVSHGFALRSGDPSTEPLHSLIGMSLGTIAVDVFFASSGFLVTASMLRRGSAVDFARARILRIYPAAIVACLLTVSLLGPAVTTLGLREYFASLTTWEYLLKGVTMIGGVSFHLPGVFESNPYPRAVNGSLWSMPWELRMYALLLVLWIGAGIAGAARMSCFRGGVVSIAVLGVILACVHELRPVANTQGIGLLAMFFVGGACHLLGDRISLPRWGGPLALGVVLGCGVAGPEAFSLAWIACAPYLILWCAYMPSRTIRVYNRLGDYSYGVYIFAFPVQQLIMRVNPEIGMISFTLFAFGISVGLAAFSWHLVEKPCLRFVSGSTTGDIARRSAASRPSLSVEAS